MEATEELIAASLAMHAAEAPSDEHLLSGVHRRLRRRRTGRAIVAVVLACAAVATAITATHSLTTKLRSDPQVAPGWRWESDKAAQVQVPASWTQYISGPAPCTTFAGYDGAWTEETPPRRRHEDQRADQRRRTPRPHPRLGRPAHRHRLLRG